jgi:hypothetical protein
MRTNATRVVLADDEVLMRVIRKHRNPDDHVSGELGDT